MVPKDFDLTDPYDAAAMYYCFLICEGCGVEPIAEPPAKYGLAHYHAVGQAAKSQGWFVAPIDGEEVSFRVYCDTCAASQRLVPTPDRRVEPTDALLIIAGLASGSPDGVTPNKSLGRTRGR
jgi:hypothetical protein